MRIKKEFPIPKKIIICDDEAEMYRLFNMTVGDDGPTATNLYEGPANVFACTCNAAGEILGENT